MPGTGGWSERETNVALKTWWRQRERKWPWVLGALLLGLLLLAGLTGGGEDRDRAASGAPATTTPPATAVIPADVVGKSPDQARDQLVAAGFRDVAVESVDGRRVIVESNWRVVAVDGAGTPVPLSTRIVLKVDKPQATTTPIPTSEPRPEPAPEPEVAAPPPPAPDLPEQPEAYYKNCAAARAANAAPLRRGEPGYRAALDGDSDGIACDK